MIIDLTIDNYFLKVLETAKQCVSFIAKALSLLLLNILEL